MDGHLTGVGWREKKLNFELRTEDDTKSLVAVSVGDEMAIEVTGDRPCIGYRAPESESLTPCPHGEKSISASQCADCLADAHILPCLRCTGERCANPLRRGSCVQPENHAVYLAAFGPDIFKVGVARWERRFERLAEQGARLALIVARDDGQQVRRVESQFRFADIPDRLTPTEKLKAYTLPTTPEELEKQLREKFEMTKLRIVGQWLKAPGVVELPAIPYLEASPQLLRPRAHFRLRGRVFAVCGQILILDTDTGERVALEATTLVGYHLRSLRPDEQGTGQLALAL